MANLKEALHAFALDGENNFVNENFGSGHINDTIKVEVRDSNPTEAYILQRVNTNVFKNPDAMMNNIIAITDFMRKEAESEELRRGVLEFKKSIDGSYLFKDSEFNYWRCYKFIDKAETYLQSKDKNSFRLSGVAFGRFMSILKDFPAEKLVETIPFFHDTEKRFETFKSVLEQDVMNRLSTCQEEVDFVLNREKDVSALVKKLADGSLPLRVTHNDTKLNNVLFSIETGEPIAVIDLDTVMPGLAAYDFGDSIRFGASTAVEDEQDLSKVNFSLELFEAYVDGYLSVCAKDLSEEEVKSLALGAKIITLETGIRFLTDYLDGDVYFKTSREGHNLDRARTQFKLVQEMEENSGEMLRILRKYSVNYGGPDFQIV